MAVAGQQRADGGLLIQAIAAHDGVVGDPARFGSVAQRVADDARRASDVEALIVALRAVAWFERSQLRNARALQLLDEAARLSRRAALPHRLGEILLTRAAVRLELGQVVASRRDLEHAGEVVTAESAPDLELKRSALLCNIGRIRAGADILRNILADPRATVDIRARSANNLGLAESLLGHSRDALRHIDLAVKFARDVGPALVGLVAHNRGVILAQAGRLAEGLRQFDDATELLTQAGIPLGEYFVEHAETLASLRALPEARELCQRAADELQRHDVPLMAAEAQLRRADIELLAGDATAARAAAEQAVEQFRRQRRPWWVALATTVAVEAARQSDQLNASDVDRACRAADALSRLGVLSSAVNASLVAGRAAHAVGRVAMARRRWSAAYELSRTGAVLVRLRGRLAGALAAASVDDDRSVLVHCRAGLADLARHRAALASMELRALASGHGVELGQLGLGAFVRAGQAARVFDWTERTRAAALLTVDPPAPDAVREERATLAALHQELVEARRETGAEPHDLLARQADAEARIRRATWGLPSSRAGAGRARSAREIRGLLDDRTLVSYVRHGAEVFAVVVDAARTRLVPLGPHAPMRFESDALLFALRRLTRSGRPNALDSARSSAEHALARLRRFVVQPLGIDPEAPLVIVPTGDTHRVAWSALHDGPVSVAPSASAWAATATRAAGIRPVVVVAGPDLPGAEQEAEKVAACHVQPTVLPPAQATTEAVLDAMADAGLVHLACHGVLRADNPIFSALRMVDGPLTVHELDLRGIAPRRIVLAACDSAADVAYAGDEVLGFVGALLARGTAGIAASVVSVGDVESVELMERLHGGLAAGLTMSEALHTARTGVDTTDPRQFVNWCAFTAYGAG